MFAWASASPSFRVTESVPRWRTTRRPARSCRTAASRSCGGSMRSTSARSAVADGPRSHQPLGRPGGRVHIGTPNEVAVEVPVFGRMAIERVIRYAIERARERRHDLASITKSNTSRCAYVLWDEVAAGLSSEYPDVRVERVQVDAMAGEMVLHSQSIDVLARHGAAP